MFGIGNKICTLLGQGAEFRGNASVEGSIVIDGRLEGNVTATERVTIGPHGVVKGNVTASEAVIGGMVQGNVSCGERAELLATAQINGDLRAPRLSMAEGGQISGKVGMEPLPFEIPAELRLAKK